MIKKEWLESERMKKPHDDAADAFAYAFTSRGMGKTAMARAGGVYKPSPKYTPRSAARDTLEDLSYLFPVFDKIATFDKIWLASRPGSLPAGVMVRYFKNAQILTFGSAASPTIKAWPDKCLVMLLGYELVGGDFTASLQRWADDNVPMFMLEYLPARLERALKEWSEQPLKSMR